MDGSDTGSARNVCRFDELQEDEAVVVDVKGKRVSIFLLDGEMYALDNTCPHQGGPLGDGKVEDGCVYCPWHGWQFDVETGEHVHGKEQANTYAVSVEDGDVYVSF